MHKFNEKDKIILEHLMHNCRISTNELSKITHLSQPSIVYRIKQLEKKGVISKYDVVINSNKFKLNKLHIFISIPQSKEPELEHFLNSSKNTVGVFKLANNYNYYAYCFFKNRVEKKAFLNTIKKSYGKYQTYETISTDFMPFSLFNIQIKSKNNKIVDENISIDKKDITIIKTLADGNGRASLLDLSKLTNLSYDIVIYRFKRLLGAGYFPLFIAQPGNKEFDIQTDILTIKTKLPFEKIKEILHQTQKFPYLTKTKSGEYITQLLSKDLNEYKLTIKKLNDSLRDHQSKIEVYNTLNWLFLNRYPLDLLN